MRTLQRASISGQSIPIRQPSMYQSFLPAEPAAPIKIVVAEPEPAARQQLVDMMSQLGVTTEGVGREDALLRSVAGSGGPDAVVLSREMGNGSGLDLLRKLRSRSGVPIIVTSRGPTEEIQRVLALELGADDHVDAEASACELLARVRAVLRRADGTIKPDASARYRSYQFAGWVFDQRRRLLVNEGGETQRLTKNEFALLSAFVVAPRRVLSREHLLNATRRHEDIYDRSIDVQVLRLRRKLGDDAQNPRLILTERGAGYIFDAEVRVR